MIAGEPSRWRLGWFETREAGIERLAFVATVLFAGATYWFAPRLPMTDLPQHAGQVAVWHDLLLGTSKWQPLLYVNYFTPYLLAYSLGLLASLVLPVSAALKLVLSLAFYGFVTACVALRKRFGGDRRLDWLFIPGFFGFANMWGFYTFLVALPFGLFFILLAHRYAERPTAALGVALVVADMALFFTHGLVFLFANAIGGVFLLLAQRRLARLVPAALPYAAAGLLCALYALVRVRIEAFAVGDPFDVDWYWNLSRLSFLMFSVSWPFREIDWSGAGVLLLALSAPLVLRARMSRDAAAFVPLAATVAVWAFVPSVALNTWAVFERFAVFLLPAYAFIFRAPDPAVARRGVVSLLWLPITCWVFLVVHSERLRAFAAESAAFDEVLEATQPGHRALMLIFKPDSPAISHPEAFMHFPLWYQAEKGGFVDFNAAGSLPPIVRYRPDRLPPSASATWKLKHPSLFDWTKDDAEMYRYFFVRRAGPLPAGYFPTGHCAPVLLKAAADWSVFENVNCYRDAGATR